MKSQHYSGWLISIESSFYRLLEFFGCSFEKLKKVAHIWFERKIQRTRSVVCKKLFFKQPDIAYWIFGGFMMWGIRCKNRFGGIFCAVKVISSENHICTRCASRWLCLHVNLYINSEKVQVQARSHLCWLLFYSSIVYTV